MQYIPKYFTNEEFKNCIPSCTIEQMDEELLRFLDVLRERCGFPLVINSAYRSKEYDKSKGRSGNSAHTKGLAVDLSCTDSTKRFKIIEVAIKMNFKRIGIGKTFIHLDLDNSLPQNVIWHYYN